MINQIEPTYLRYIRDGLKKEAIHPDNASALPDGLIGLYEEAFEENLSAVERQKLLEQFAIWALLKKEVSANFVAEVLDVKEENVLDFIAAYSKWFNSPEPGKYQLYHERLRVFLFQKLSEKEVQILHIKLIDRLEKAIEEKKADEFEYYALQHLSDHLLLIALENKNGKSLIEWGYDTNIWARQISIGKNYEWTRKVLDNIMFWAYIHDKNEIIECGFKFIAFHDSKLDSSGFTLNVLENSDPIKTIENISAYVTEDEKGIDKKMYLFLICLAEITFSDKPEDFKKGAINEFLSEFKKQIPPTRQGYNLWNEFFPSNLMFNMALEWKRIGCDWRIVYSNFGGFEWSKETQLIVNDIALNENSLEILLTILKLSSNDDEFPGVLENKANIQLEIASKLFLNEKSDEAKKIIKDLINNKFLRNYYDEDLFEEIKSKSALILKENGHDDACSKIISLITNSEIKLKTLNECSRLAIKKGDLEDALKTIEIITNKEITDAALFEINLESVKNFDLEEFKKKILLNEVEKSNNIALQDLSLTLCIKGNYNYALSISKKITDPVIRDKLLITFCKHFIQKNDLNLAKEIIYNEITYGYWKCKAMIGISEELRLQSDQTNASKCIKEALEISLSLEINRERDFLIKDIALEISKQDGFETALFLINDELNDAFISAYCKFEISLLMPNQINQSKAQDLRKEVIETILKKSAQDEYFLCNKLLINFSEKLIKNELFTELDHIIINKKKKMFDTDSLRFLAISFAQRNKINEAFYYAEMITDEGWKDSAIMYIAMEVFKNSNVVFAEEIAKRINSMQIKQDSYQLFANLISGQKDYLSLLGFTEETSLNAYNTLTITPNNTLKSISKFAASEMKFQVSKGLINNYYLSQYDLDYTTKLILLTAADRSSLCKLLEMHLMQDLFFANLAESNNSRKHHESINFQWAVDLKNELMLNN